MLTGLFQSVIVAITGVAYYVADFYLMHRYDRERPDGGSGRSWGYTLLMLCVLGFLSIQPIAWPQFSLHWSSSVGLVFQVVGVALIGLALALHWWARGHLGRFYVENVVMQGDHQIVSTGPYQCVRHPTFTSFFLIVTGFVLVNPAIPTIVMMIYAVIDFTGAALREERLLADELDGYVEYMQRTRRFFPCLRDWAAIASWVASTVVEVPTPDPDDARRRRLLNIMLMGLAALTIVGILVLTVFSANITATEMVQMVAALVAAAVGVVVIYAINRWWSGDLAGTLFVSLLLVVVVVSDTPRQVVEGRTLIIFTIPILMASVILRPWASFAVAGASSAIITAIAQFRIGILPPVPSMLGFFAFALVSWLSARSLEDALRDLRAINRRLDQMVEERTRELQATNEELAEANEHLREMDRLKSRFLSMVSHDLRTPLGAIQGFAELLQAELYGPLSDKQENALERIEVNTRQLLHLVNDLLDQARIEAGGLTLHPEPFSPAELIEDLKSTMGVLAESEGLTLTTTIDDDMPERLLGDEKRLHQILVNLVNNAIKFTEEGGVHVRVYRVDSEPSRWAIAVTDTGPGISKEDQGYIFEPFRRVDDSITRAHGGVGLGLSIVKQLTALMDGDIALDSQKGQGSTFTVALPLEE